MKNGLLVIYHRSPAHHSLADKEAASHEEQTPHKKKLGHPRRVLRLPDLDHAKTAVLNTLLSLDSQRAYRFAMDDFIAWYCSEPRLAFNKTVVLRYKLRELPAGVGKSRQKFTDSALIARGTQPI